MGRNKIKRIYAGFLAQFDAQKRSYVNAVNFKLLGTFEYCRGCKSKMLIHVLIYYGNKHNIEANKRNITKYEA